MDTLESNAVPKKKGRKRKILGAILASVFVIAGIQHITWKPAGSGLWEPVGEKQGVKVFSKKTPGERMLDFKAKVRVKSSLSAAVALFMDPDSCPEWMPGCVVGQYLEPMNDEELYYIHSYVMELPFPFEPREAILKTSFTQDPVSKEVVINFKAMPDLLPLDDCCLRVTQVNNFWTFTPIGNDELEVTLRTDADFGGNIPYAMVNLDSPRMLYTFLGSLQGFLDREKYQTASFDFIQEVDSNQLSMDNH